MRVLAENRSGPLRSAGRPPQLDRHAELAHGPLGARLIELHDHLSRAHELRVERLVQVEQRLEAAVVVRRELRPLVARAPEEDPLHLGVRLGAGRVELALDQVLAPDAPAPRLPELRLERTERHPAVAAGVRSVADERAGQLEVAPVRRALLREVASCDQREPGQRAV